MFPYRPSVIRMPMNLLPKIHIKGAYTFSSCKPGQNNLPLLKKMLNIFINISTEYPLYIQYVFTYLASLYELFWHNIIKYIHGHFLTMMID